MNSEATPSGPLLRLSNINTFYGPMQVHFDLSIDVQRGQIVCLLGGNASGKSTTMKIILGLVQPRSGDVTFDGASIAGLPTPQIVRRGIGSVPEARRLFGGHDRARKHADGRLRAQRQRRSRQGSRTDAGAVSQARANGFTTRRHASGGEQQMVAMARALMGRPR